MSKILNFDETRNKPDKKLERMYYEATGTKKTATGIIDEIADKLDAVKVQKESIDALFLMVHKCIVQDFHNERWDEALEGVNVLKEVINGQRELQERIKEEIPRIFSKATDETR